MSTEPLLNLEETLERMSGDRELLASLFQLFGDDVPKKMGTIDASIQEGDMYQIERTAHSLKGASATVGAVRLCQVAARVEQAAKGGRSGEMALLRQELDQVWRQTLAAIHEFGGAGS
jgi:HPt (histidine-containing phosphotransfer) domain-containing protein